MNPDASSAAATLTHNILAGDVDAVRSQLVVLPPAERARLRQHALKLREQVSQMQWSRQTHDDGTVTTSGHSTASRTQVEAAALAVMACGTAQDVVDAWTDAGELIALARHCELRCLDGLAEAYLARSPATIGTVQELVVAGLVPRPDSEAYITGLIALPRTLYFGQDKLSMKACLEADPALIPLLLRLFEVEGTGEHNLAAVDKYARREDLQWDRIFLMLSREGYFSRDQLLDKTLDTLARDWPQFRAGWFSRFHGVLAPTVDEMAPHAPRYLGLCQSRIAPTVTFALGALKTLLAAGKIEGSALLAALQPVFYASVKAQVDAALKLADAVVKRDGALAHAASAVAMHGLQHEAADLQKKIIERLRAWGLDAAMREALAAQLDGVAGVNRPALAALVGEPVATKRAAASSADMPVVPLGTGPLDPLDASRVLVPIDDVAELVERTAFVLENPAATDELERVLEALVRMAPLPADQRAAFAPVLKRARKLRSDAAVARHLARLLVFVASGERMPRPPTNDYLIRRDKVAGDGLLSLRIDDLIEQAAAGWGLAPLSAATHAGGFIDPAVFELRMTAWRTRVVGTALSPVLLGEEARARLRLWPAAERGQPLTYAWSLRVSQWEVQGKAYTHHHFELTGVDTDGLGRSPDWADASVLYRASIQPGRLEAFFADGCNAIGNNLDWWEAQWHNRAYIDLLLAPTTPITAEQPMAVLLLALALAGKEPGQTALAVDALVHAHLDGRLDAPALATQLRTLLATPLVMAKRYARSLQGAVRADARLAPVVCGLLCEMIMANVESPPRDLAVLLELLLELSLTQAQPLPAGTRAALMAMPLGGKGKAALKALLLLPDA